MTKKRLKFLAKKVSQMQKNKITKDRAMKIAQDLQKQKQQQQTKGIGGIER